MTSVIPNVPFTFVFKFYLYLCVCVVLLVCMCANMFTCPQGPERGSDALELELRGVVILPMRMLGTSWERDSGLLEEQQVL